MFGVSLERWDDISRTEVVLLHRRSLIVKITMDTFVAEEQIDVLQ